MLTEAVIVQLIIGAVALVTPIISVVIGWILHAQGKQLYHEVNSKAARAEERLLLAIGKIEALERVNIARTRDEDDQTLA